MKYRSQADLNEDFENRIDNLESYLLKIGAKNNLEKKEEDCIPQRD